MRLPSASGNWPTPRPGPQRTSPAARSARVVSCAHLPSCRPVLVLRAGIGPATASRGQMMGYVIRLARGMAFGWGLAAVLAPVSAGAQVPSEAADIAGCLCLQQGVSTLSAEMNTKNQALDTVTRQLADLDSQLARAIGRRSMSTTPMRSRATRLCSSGATPPIGSRSARFTRRLPKLPRDTTRGSANTMRTAPIARSVRLSWRKCRSTWCARRCNRQGHNFSSALPPSLPALQTCAPRLPRCARNDAPLSLRGAERRSNLGPDQGGADLAIRNRFEALRARRSPPG